MRLRFPPCLAFSAVLFLGACSGTEGPPAEPIEPAEPAESTGPAAPAPGEPVPTGPPPMTSEPAPPPADATPPSEPVEPGAYREAASASGAFTLRWRPLASEVPNNEPFELEFVLERDGRPVPDASVRVRAWMPDHGHGMLRRPEVEDRGDGSYLVRGMLLHMGGFWELFFDVYEPGRPKDPVRFELNL